jgi:NAD(P)H dehydrogenase (quinone)
MKKITIVYHSGYGHTQIQAEHVLKGAQTISGVQTTLITSDEAIKDLSRLNEADAIIFGCPTYMGGPSAQFKTFIDAASKVWFQQGWKNNLAAGFTNSGSPSGDKLATLQALFINAMQHSMVWVGLGAMNGAKDAQDIEAINRLGSFSGAMSQSPQGTPSPLESDLKTAELLGKRVAQAALSWTPTEGL